MISQSTSLSTSANAVAMVPPGTSRRRRLAIVAHRHSLCRRGSAVSYEPRMVAAASAVWGFTVPGYPRA